jgi:hypothetical protein
MAKASATARMGEAAPREWIFRCRALVFHRRGEQAAAAADRARALAMDPEVDEDYREYGFTDF